MRMRGTICGGWLLSALIGCASLGEKSPGTHGSNLAAHNRRAAETCNARGLELVERSEWEEAEALFRRAIRSDPQFGPAQNNLGLVLMVQGEFCEAKARLATASSLCPNSLEPMRNGELLRSVFQGKIGSCTEQTSFAASIACSLQAEKSHQVGQKGTIK